MRRSSWPCLLAVLACDATPDPGPPGPPPGGASPEIVFFEASPTEVAPGETTTLRWSVKNAGVVEVGTAEETLVASLTQEGITTSRPLLTTTRFVLVAKNGALRSTRELDVTVTWPPPTVEELQVAPNPAYAGSFVTISFRPLNWLRGQLLEGDRLHTELTRGVQFLNLGVVPATTTVTYSIRLSNPQGEVTTPVPLTLQEPPRVTVFQVAPRTLFSGATTATVTWQAEHTGAVDLAVDGVTPQRFGASGRFNFLARGPANITLTLLSEADLLPVWGVTRYIGVATREAEPNDSFPPNQDIGEPGGVSGDLSSADDVDYYSVVALGVFRSFYARTSGAGTPCDTDTSLVLLSIEGRELARATGGGPSAPGGGDCAVIDVELGPEDARIGQAYLRVEGAPGPYRLEAGFFD